MTADIGHPPVLSTEDMINYLRHAPSPRVLLYALIDDDEANDRFLLGVFLNKDSAQREANTWAGESHIEMIELEP